MRCGFVFHLIYQQSFFFDCDFTLVDRHIFTLIKIAISLNTEHYACAAEQMNDI